MTGGGRVDVADDTFVVADPETVAALVGDHAAWARWWPDLRLTVCRDRGVQGVQWLVTGAVEGTMEVWLEPWGDGVLVHHYLRGRAVSGRRRSGRGERLARRHVRRWKQVVHALKDDLERGRAPGTPRTVRPAAQDRVAAAGPSGNRVKAGRQRAEVPVREQSDVPHLRRPRAR